MNRKSHHKLQVTSKYTFNVYGELLPNYPPSTEQGQRLHLLLTKANQKSSHVLSADWEEPFIYFSYKEASLLGGRRYYKDNFQILINLGLLEPIKKCNAYNHKQYLMAFKPIILKPKRYKERITHKRIHENLVGFYKAKSKGLSDGVLRYVVSTLKKIKINISEQMFLELVKQNYLTYVNDYRKDRKNALRKPLPFNDYVENCFNLYNHLMAFNTATGDEIFGFITQDSFSGRIHTPITVIPRYLKKQDIIEYNGESMVELDIKTFQPLLLAVILGDTDYSRWYFSVDDCYVELQKEFDLPSRESAKEFFYQLVFGTKYGKSHKLFCERFPEAGNMLTNWKTTFDSTNPNSYKTLKNGRVRSNFHSNVSMRTQRAEVKFMRMIWGALGRNKIPFVTIHDAVLVPESYADRAEQLFKHYLEIRFRGKAILKRTNLSEDSNKHGVAQVI